jgi:hypothetical protein
MGPIASLRSLWTFPHIRRKGSPSECGYCLPLSIPPYSRRRRSRRRRRRRRRCRRRRRRRRRRAASAAATARHCSLLRNRIACIVLYFILLRVAVAPIVAVAGVAHQHAKLTSCMPGPIDHPDEPGPLRDTTALRCRGRDRARGGRAQWPCHIVPTERPAAGFSEGASSVSPNRGWIAYMKSPSPIFAHVSDRYVLPSAPSGEFARDRAGPDLRQGVRRP